MSIGSLLWSFDGRIGRARFWLGIVLLFAIGVGLGFIATLLGIPLEALEKPDEVELGTGGLLYLLVAIVILGYIQLAIYAKRCHDRGKSAWWVLLALVPGIGVLWVLIELGMLPGDAGPNAYGPPDGGTPALA